MAEMAEPFPFALVGCGEIALSNARAIASSGVASLSASIDSDPDLAKDLAARHGGRPFERLEDALTAAAFEAVIISTPHDSHEPIARAALAAGKHVIVEKPLARTMPEAASMVRAARRAGRSLSVFFPLRYQPEMRWARSFIERGGLGRILGFRVVEHLYKEMAYWTGGASGRSRVAWRGVRERSGGGVLLMNVIHQLDLLRHLTGMEVTRVYCEYDTLDTPVDVEDAAAMVVRLGDRAIGMVDATTCMAGDGPSDLRLWGSEGQIVLTPPHRHLTLRNGLGVRPGEWHRLARQKASPARAAFLREFVAAVRAGHAVPCPGEDGLAVQAVIDAAYASMQRREAVVPQPVEEALREP